MTTTNTGIIADGRYARHLTGFGHPECPERYTAVITALEAASLKTPSNTVVPRSATVEEVALCHTKEYIALVEHEAGETLRCGVVDGSVCVSTGDASICPVSYEIALLAAGGALTAVDAVMEGRHRNAFAVVRPPGHHACKDRGMGFCLFNNVAIAARYAQRRYDLERVLIVDWDVHHGNGTQDIFNDDPSVFYFSTHQHPFYPGSGTAEEKGSDKAAGTTVNIPIAGGAESRRAVLEAFTKTLPEVIEAFRPELVLVSAGFDAHVDDTIGGMSLCTEDFAALTGAVVSVADTYADGRVVSVLEGGYDLTALANAAVAHVAALERS